MRIRSVLFTIDDRMVFPRDSDSVILRKNQTESIKKHPAKPYVRVQLGTLGGEIIIQVELIIKIIKQICI